MDEHLTTEQAIRRDALDRAIQMQALNGGGVAAVQVTRMAKSFEKFIIDGTTES